MTTRKKKNPKITSDNILEIKTSLLSDLDQFLIDENIDHGQRQEQKQKALAELDKLIRQELPYNSILSSIKKDSQKDIQEKSAPLSAKTSKERGDDDFPPLRSSHVLDLRPLTSGGKKPKANLEEGYRNFKEKIRASLKKANSEKNKTSAKTSSVLPPKIKTRQNFSLKINTPAIFNTLDWRSAFSKGISFALIVLLLLAPIRALVFLNNFQADKLKLFDFGWQGILDFQSGAISASEHSYDTAQADFERALVNFQQAQEILSQYNQSLLGAASYIPVLGRPFSLSQDLLEVAASLSEAAGILNEQATIGANPTEYIYVVHRQIKTSLPHLESANKKLQGSSLVLLPPELKPYFEELKVYLPLALENFYTLEDIFSVLLGILGHDSQQRYLFLFQNNNELRASGGFIGSIAIFDIYQGKVNKLEIPRGGTYDLAYGQKINLKAPDALSLINPNFNIWDANWWYDFPTSAKKIIWFYQEAPLVSPPKNTTYH